MIGNGKDYAIVSSLVDGGIYFLFCPKGIEKKFSISKENNIIPWGNMGFSDNEKTFIRNKLINE